MNALLCPPVQVSRLACAKTLAPVPQCKSLGLSNAERFTKSKRRIRKSRQSAAADVLIGFGVWLRPSAEHQSYICIRAAHREEEAHSSHIKNSQVRHL